MTNFFNRLFIIAEQMAEQQRLINIYYEVGGNGIYVFHCR